MPNLGGPKQAKRGLLASVVVSQLLYASPVWCSSLVFRNHKNIILGPQRKVALRVARAYRTVSTIAILVVAGCTPVHLIARGRGELRRLMKSGVATQVARSIVDDLVWRWWQTEWTTEEGTGIWTIEGWSPTYAVGPIGSTVRSAITWRSFWRATVAFSNISTDFVRSP